VEASTREMIANGSFGFICDRPMRYRPAMLDASVLTDSFGTSEIKLQVTAIHVPNHAERHAGKGRVD